MEQATTSKARLLYIVWELQRHNKLTTDSREKVKELILTCDPAMFATLDVFLKTNDRVALERSMLTLSRPARVKPRVSIPSRSSSQADTSPLGSFLHEKKKRLKGEKTLKLSISEPTIISISERLELEEA
jgi:hypothetical protein